MLQYLFNATAIWLLSLLMYDALLRKETFHAYNRLYLLVTFLMGAFLPLYTWQDQLTLSEYNVIDNNPDLQKIVAANPATAPGPATVQASFDWSNLLLIIYCMGVAISMLLLVRDAVRIARLYRNGVKYRNGNMTFIETGVEHSPFSAFGSVYICDRNSYTPEQLTMIWVHEEAHNHLLHFADLLLLQCARILFWFHPLVYIYYKRLVMLHEYQADITIERSPKDYGSFLIEQALLQKAPALSHSFNRSPIKNRIFMLTRKSTTLSQSKLLLAIPLLAVCVLCFSKNAFSEARKVKQGNKIIYKGNEFELWSPSGGGDTVIVQNPATGEMQMRIVRIDSFPVAMNGKKIYKDDGTDSYPSYVGPGVDMDHYLFDKLKPLIEQLPESKYWKLYITNIVVDENGKVVFSDNEGMINYEKNSNGYIAFSPNSITIDAAGNMIDSDDPHSAKMKGADYVKTLTKEQLETLRKIYRETEKILGSRTFYKPATKDGKPVIYMIDALFKPRQMIQVAGGNASLYHP